MKIANDEQQKILDIIRTKIEKGLTLPNEQDKAKYVDLDYIAGDGNKRILRALRQFDSDISIVTVMGMLKAGKSTFVNLLARHPNASPMGYGKDTTLRPALICMARPEEDVKDGKIIVYESPSEESNDAFDKRLDDILDELRGIAEQGKKLPIEELSLTQKNLGRVLCSEAGTENVLRKEPALVVVKIPYNKEVTLLKDGNCLLDMPGLDSATAEVSISPGKYNKLTKQCDLVLFLQSSVAPLNEKAVDSFKEVTLYRSNATVWGIQNTMLNKPWMKGDIIKEEQTEQLRNARKLMEKMQKNPSLSVVNLGLAYAGYLQDGNKLRLGAEMPGLDLQDSPIKIKPEELQRVSKFSEVEGQIINSLTKSGQFVRLTSCTETLDAQLSVTAKEFSKRIADLEAVMSELKDQTEKQRRIYNNWDHELKNLRANITDTTVNYDTKELKADMQAVFDGLLKDFKKECEGSLVDKALKSGSKQCLVKARDFLDMFRLGLVKIGDNLMSNECRDKVTEAVKNNWEKCEEMKRDESMNLPSCDPISPGLKWPYQGSSITQVDANMTYETSNWLTRNIFRWVEPNIKFSKTEWDTSVNHIINGYIQQVENILKSRFHDWADDIVREAAQDTMRRHLESKKAKIEADSKKIAQTQKELALISNMQQVIKECQQYSNRIR